MVEVLFLYINIVCALIKLIQLIVVHAWLKKLESVVVYNRNVIGLV